MGSFSAPAQYGSYWDGCEVNEGSSSEIREETVPDDQFYMRPQTTSCDQSFVRILMSFVPS
jgi:hypothetical protein